MVECTLKNLSCAPVLQIAQISGQHLQAAVDMLNRSLLTDLLPVDLARGGGLLALGVLGPLRRLVMRQGVLPHVGVPTLMRG